MKAGARALGVAESYAGTAADESAAPDASPRASVLAGAVVRADRVVDGLGFETCTVGGTDATDAVRSLFRSLDRADIRYLLLAGIAPAWFNVFDLRRLHEALDRPVLSVSFEASQGLADALREQFDGDALTERLDTYRRQPPRRDLSVNDERVFVRAVGCEAAEAAEVVRAFTPAGGRPEPLRVARLAARAGRAWHEQ